VVVGVARIERTMAAYGHEWRHGSAWEKKKSKKYKKNPSEKARKPNKYSKTNDDNTKA